MHHRRIQAPEGGKMVGGARGIRRKMRRSRRREGKHKQAAKVSQDRNSDYTQLRRAAAISTWDLGLSAGDQASHSFSRQRWSRRQNSTAWGVVLPRTTKPSRPAPSACNREDSAPSTITGKKKKFAAIRADSHDKNDGSQQTHKRASR